MQLRGQRDVGHDDDVQGAGSVLGFLGNITAGVVLVFAFALALPGSAGNGDGALEVDFVGERPAGRYI